jgi:hypothetical protein
VAVRAWQAHDTGLVAVPSRFRRLGGRVRHHQGRGPRWPAEVGLELVGGALVVTAPGGAEVGRWPASAVLLSSGPPLQFTVDLGDDGTVLLNAAATPEAIALVQRLSAGPV